MLSVRNLSRAVIPYSRATQKPHTAVILHCNQMSSDSSDSESDNEKEKQMSMAPEKNMEEKQNFSSDANDRLNMLLDKMIKGTKVAENINVAKSVKTNVFKTKQVLERNDKKTVENKLVNAAKAVASSIKGDKKQIEADLLHKILHTDIQEESLMKRTLEEIPKQDTTPLTEQQFSQDLIHILSAMKVSIHQPASEETEFIDKEALKKAKLARKYTQPKHFNQRIEIQDKREKTLQKKQHFGKRSDAQTFNLYGGTKLNIFGTKEHPLPNIPALSIWNILEQRELKLSITQPPENYFQEIIQWTEKGILWHFPINNEQGMESENDIHFSEHVFMERYLQGWCPKKGPIRHFMELVCVGLSKNAFLTVEEKKAHITWYKDYFTGKEVILREIGALPEEHSFKEIQA